MRKALCVLLVVLGASAGLVSTATADTSPAFVTAGIVALNAESASAFPSDCVAKWGSHSTQAWAQCYAGTGQYRVKIMCDASTDFPWYGPWYAVGSGMPSYATCPGYETAVAKYYERRGFGL